MSRVCGVTILLCSDGHAPQAMSAYLFTRRATASRLSAVPRRVGDDSVLVQTLGGVPVPILPPWLVGLSVPTIGGERLELARIAMGRPQDGSWYSSPVAWWSAWSPNCCGHKPGGGVDVPLLDHADVRPYRQRAPRGSRDRTTRPSPMDRSYLLVQTELYLGPQGEPLDMEKLQAERPDAVVFSGYANQYDHRPLRRPSPCDTKG